ncbi:2-hydroxymuconate semialdehyde hydrolase-like [Panicum miliaceum]|uniref:2-hydroxymuconate semialdehyde hydrolase-like n=1 Tax=Panicum miliaceum TaxID=4540 RepID=A0A3L6TL36_PANMI|nr:2-hydroxymuconate semialdehyde hydrolase-like [Panicum miliaceum]
MGGSLSLVPVLDYFARREFLAAGLRQNAVTLPYPDGGAGATCTVHYWAPPGEPRLPPLLLVHGFGPRATWQWRCQVGPLSRHFHVIVPDLLGFGGSTYPFETAPPPSEATQAAALAALLDALPGMEGRRVAAAGTSYGGFVTYWLARAAGAGRVGPVVIASSDLLKTAADDRGFLKRAGEGWSGVDQILLPAEPAAIRKLLELVSYRPPPRAMMPDFLLRDFIQDVLIVWGDHDQLFPLEKAFAVQRFLNGSARLEVVKKTGHAPQLEDPARFNKVVLDFLLAAHKSDPSVDGGSQ